MESETFEQKTFFIFVSVFNSLTCSADFLSMIFGILGKFWIDIGVRKKFLIFFRDEKVFSKNVFGENLENF